MNERRGGRWLAAVVGIEAAALCVAYAATAAHRYLVNDDYQILYTAWMKAEGKVPGRDFFVASYHLLVEMLRPLFRLFGHSLAPLYLGRALLIVTAAGVGLLLFRITDRLFGRTAAWLAPLLALGSSAFFQRALDVRPDLFTTLLWLLLFDRLADERPLRRRSYVWLGALVALAGINRFKALLVAPVVAALVCWRLVRARPPRPLPRALAEAAGAGLLGFAIPALAYAGLLALDDSPGGFLATNRKLLGHMADYAQVTVGLRATTLVSALRADPLFWAFAVLGLGLALGRRATRQPIPIALGLLAVASVALNPAYYAYNLVTLIPLVAPLAAYGFAQILDAWRARAKNGASAEIAAALLAGLVLAQHADRFVHAATTDSSVDQRRLLTFLDRYTAPSAPVFALEGVGLFRPSVFHWHMPEILRPLYRRGAFDFASELARTPAEVVVLSYRLPAWLLPRDRQFLFSHYVRYSPLLLVPGYRGAPGGGEQPFDLLVGGDYDPLPHPPGSCVVDGTTLTVGRPIALAAGPHRLGGTAAMCGLRKHYPPEAYALVAAPTWPYLISPQLAAPGEP